MGKALYRSYRARSFKDVIGQEHITKTLTNSLKNNRHNHAYLLTGPRGVGKTSVARILAHEVNNLPYKEEQLPIDIIEIDAASNRRIDEIRDIKEKSAIAPVQAKYKVYIVDEVHMLTKESFNALLKTLEEPPSHVIFILATTELHKLPETIISRCIHFPFKPISRQNLVDHLSSIAKAEDIKISSEAIELIAAHGRGSFRDSISLLDQIRSFGSEVTLNDVRHSLGLAPDELISKIVDAVCSSDVAGLMKQLDSLYEFGADSVVASQQILERVRAQLIEGKLGLAPEDAIGFMKRLLDVPATVDPKKNLEITLIGMAISNSSADEIQEPAEEPAKSKPLGKTPDKGSSAWDKVLTELKTSNRTLYGIVRIAEHSISDDSITLKFRFPFHYKQVTQEKNLSTLKRLIADIAGKDYDLSIQQLDSPEYEKKFQADKSLSQHKNISNIFGSGEMLES